MDAALADHSLTSPPAACRADSSPPSARDASRDAWGVRERDVPRRMRLVAAACLPAAAVALLIGFAPSLPPPAKVVEEDAPIEALLVDAPEVPLPPDPVATEPSPAALAPAPGPLIQRVEAPKEIPVTVPEKELPAPVGPADSTPPTDGATEGPAGGGGPIGGTGTGLGAPARPAPPPPKALPPRPPPVAPVPEEITPPKAISMKSPAYPGAAKSAGIEGTVVIAYTVSESGSVTEARVVKGPPELAAACLDAVRAWRFSPAQSGGRAVAVKRSARFPFRLRT